MSTNPKPRLTPEQYLEIERKAEFKSEFYDGEMFAMAGAQSPHVIAVVNLTILLGPVRDRCTLYANDMRVLVKPTGLYTYPDIVVACSEPAFADDTFDTLTNPTLVIEVLSPSTESYDRGKKFDHYRAIDSLRQYVLVSTDRPHIDSFLRVGDGWEFSAANGLDAELRLEAVGITVRLSDVYLRIQF